MFKTVFLTNFFNPICFVFFNTNSFWWDFYSFTIKIEKGKSQIFCNFCIFCNLSFFYICDILHLFYVFDILVLFRIFHFFIFFLIFIYISRLLFLQFFGFIIFSNVFWKFAIVFNSYVNSYNFDWRKKFIYFLYDIFYIDAVFLEGSTFLYKIKWFFAAIFIWFESDHSIFFTIFFYENHFNVIFKNQI